MTDAQRELLEDKFVLWERESRQGPTDFRDYNARAAEALKVVLSIASAVPSDGWMQEVVEVLTEVLARDGFLSPSGMPNSCGCINLSHEAEREYEDGRCPHQRARALLLRLRGASHG